MSVDKAILPKWASSPFKDSLVIGFGHKARHGKDFAAESILRDANVPIRVIRFAESLYSYCRIAFGMRKKDPHLLQTVGTEVLRYRDPDIFVRVLYDTLVENPAEVVLIPDVRFPNEVQMIKDVGGYVVKVVRLQNENAGYFTPYVSKDRDPNHPSETALDSFLDWDARIIARDGNVTGLAQQACAVYRNLLGRRWDGADSVPAYCESGLVDADKARSCFAAGLAGSLPVTVSSPSPSSDSTGHAEPSVHPHAGWNVPQHD